MEKIKNWLRIFRAQTAPLTVVTVMAAYLNGEWKPLDALILLVFLVLIHWFSYGHNSLMDTALGYDQRDDNKQHHPLVNGIISLTNGHVMIHIGIVMITVLVSLFSIMISTQPTLTITLLLLWTVLGQAYNDGLSKESILGPYMISLMSVCMVWWGWSLSHSTIDLVGILYGIYIFLLIMFQISWDGSLKDLTQPEKSNILIKLGVCIRDVEVKLPRIFNPGIVVRTLDELYVPRKAKIYAYSLKFSSLLVALFMIFLQFNEPTILIIAMIYFIIVSLLSYTFWKDLVKTQLWNRPKLLAVMSYEQIFSIYLPIPLIMEPVLALFLMSTGVVYFVKMNKWLWDSSYPKV